MDTEVQIGFSDKDFDALSSWLNPSNIDTGECAWNVDGSSIEQFMTTYNNINTGDAFSSPLSSPYDSAQDSPNMTDPFTFPESSSSDEEASDFFIINGDNVQWNSSLILPTVSPGDTNMFDNASAAPFCAPIEPTKQNIEVEESDKRNKKRRRGADGPNKFANGKFTPLSNEQLLNLDSKEIEDYIRALSSFKSLAPSEEKELKRIRRLIKNREYAQSSRNKKKQYVEELEAKLAEVNEEKAAIAQRLSQMELENKTLKLQLTKIGNAIKKDPIVLERLKLQATPSRKASLVKTGVTTLFILLFSVALVFQVGPSNPASLLSVSHSATQGYNTGRTLKTLGLLDTSYSTSQEHPIPVWMKYAPEFVADFAYRYIWTIPEDGLNESLDFSSRPQIRMPTNGSVSVPTKENKSFHCKSIVKNPFLEAEPLCQSTCV